METNGFPIANLSGNTVQEIKRLEDQLRSNTDRDIILIAYEKPEERKSADT